MRKLEGRVTILYNRDEGVRIELKDYSSSLIIVETVISAEAFCEAALGRLASVECEFQTQDDLSKIGKKMIIDKLEFKMPGKIYGKERKKIAYEEALRNIPDGWKADNYFGAQGSFFMKDGEEWARCTIRKWE